MMQLNAKVYINRSRIRGRTDEFKKALYRAVKTQIYVGSTPYTPYLGGDLMDSGQASAYDETNQLVYNIAYAKYQYYANGGAPMRDFPGRTKTIHTLASMMWVDEYLSAGGRRDIDIICRDAPTVLRF